MQLCNTLFKIPMLLGIVAANHVTYTSPNPPTTFSESNVPVGAAYFTIIMRPPWVRKISKMIVRTIAILEVVALALVVLPQGRGSQYSANLTSTLRPIQSGGQSIRLTPTFLFGWILLTAGAIARKACYRSMGKAFTFEVTIQKNHLLVTSGLYAIVRHPSYTAMCMVALGTMLCLLGSGSWLVECGILESWVGKTFTLLWITDLVYVPSVMVFSQIRTEDELLKKRFGREWEGWASRTPYALIPGVY